MTDHTLRSLRHFMLDMDGTLYLGDRLLPGAKAFIDGLTARGLSYLCLTNNPTKTAEAYAEKLQRLGVDVPPSQILTAGEATARFLAAETPHRRIHPLGPPAFAEELERAGLQVTVEEPDAVVLAFDITLDYERLKQFCRHVLAGLPYYATNPDLVCPTEAGPIPDCGAMAAMIAAATGRTPQYIGKPEATMLRMGLKKLQAEAGQTAMVGDRLYTDMEMAYRAGIASVLVLSGETKFEDLPEESGQRRPDFIFENVGALWEALQSARGEV